MNVTIDRNVLSGALARVKPAVLRNALPALAGVHVEATADGVTLAATNLDARITTTVAAEVAEVGRFLVPHETLDRIVANSPTGPVSLALDDDQVKVRAGKVKASLRTLDEATFPIAPTMEAPKVATLTDDWRAIQRVLHARSHDRNRPVLCGINVRDGLAQATDSFRMAQHVVESDVDFLFEPACLAAAVRACPDGPITLRWQGRRFEVAAADTVWSGTSIEGEFPKVAGLIPATCPVSFTTSREELTGAVKAAGAIGEETYTDKSGKAYNSNTVRLVVGDDEVVVQCHNRDTGEAEVAVEAGCVGAIEVAFNAPYLLAMVGACTSEVVTLAGVDALKPWKVVDGDLTQILMPVRIAGR